MIYVVISVRDEEQDLIRMLRGLREVSSPSRERYRVVVVDDGSRDDTRISACAFARDFDLSLVSHPVPAGAGAALRTGVKLVLAEANPDDVLVATAAGAGHDLSVVPELARALRRRSAGGAVHSGHPDPLGQVLLADRSLLRQGLGRGLRLKSGSNGARPQADPGPTAFRVASLREARVTAERDIPVAPDSRGAAELVMRLQREGEAVVDIGPPTAARPTRRVVRHPASDLDCTREIGARPGVGGA
jgi:hypothetical protein